MVIKTQRGSVQFCHFKGQFNDRMVRNIFFYIRFIKYNCYICSCD